MELSEIDLRPSSLSTSTGLLTLLISFSFPSKFPSTFIDTSCSTLFGDDQPKNPASPELCRSTYTGFPVPATSSPRAKQQLPQPPQHRRQPPLGRRQQHEISLLRGKPA
ncbi:hypothetical protein J6590_054975 [Homalodisca vitripennis]|nr:hypothetical protein J6590_054975 [Homalodisca vitripennis]